MLSPAWISSHLCNCFPTALNLSTSSPQIVLLRNDDAPVGSHSPHLLKLSTIVNKCRHKVLFSCFYLFLFLCLTNVVTRVHIFMRYLYFLFPETIISFLDPLCYHYLCD